MICKIDNGCDMLRTLQNVQQISAMFLKKIICRGAATMLAYRCWTFYVLIPSRKKGDFLTKMNDQKYNISLSFNAGLAQDVGIIAALVFDELSFWSGKGSNEDGWIYKSYSEMLSKLPISEFQLRKAYKTLTKCGLIETKIAKINGNPTLHYRILKNFRIDDLVSEKIKETMVSEKIKETIYNTETNHKLDKNSFQDLNKTAASIPNKFPRGLTNDHKDYKFATLEEIIQIVNPREKKTESRMRLLNARLKEYSKDEVIAAAKAFSKSQWHKENGQMSIDNLLAPSKFGRWHTASTEPPKTRSAF